MCSHFSGLGQTKVTPQQLIFAYYLIRGAFKGDLKSISEQISRDPNYFLDFNPTHILPILRPMGETEYRKALTDSSNNKIACNREYRACRMLTISCTSYRTEFTFPRFSRVVFTFDVHYCMRKHHIEKDYEDFQILFDEISKELVTIPIFPDATIFSNSQIVGDKLAEFAMRIHMILSNKNLFSPRLLNFLSIDYERVQSEEEGAVLSVLDTPQLPPNTVWHIISEKWLQQWRKFAIGRGARRYLPPGKVDNEELITRLKKDAAEHTRLLKITVDYRCVNYNVWRFYILVHGGGPNISKKEEDIYSPTGFSYLDGIIKIQTRMRICLNIAMRKQLYVKALSTSRAAKSVMIELVVSNVTNNIEEKIKTDQEARIISRTDEAAKLTQILWRKKKRYIPEKSLQRKQRDQEVFARSKIIDNSDDHTSSHSYGNNEFIAEKVIIDENPIVSIGNASIFTWQLVNRNDPIPFKMKRLFGTSTTVLLADSMLPTVLPNDCKILSINSIPASSLTYEELKRHILTLPYPLTFEFERPLKLEHVPTLESILAITDQPNLQYNAFKIMLSRGFHLLKYNTGNGKSHVSCIRISDKDFFYRSKENPSKSEDQMWNAFSLFSLKFILNGKESGIISKRDAVQRHSFEIVNEDRGIAFELPDDKKMFKYMQLQEKDEVMMKERAEYFKSTGVCVIDTNSINHHVYKLRQQYMSEQHVDDAAYHQLKCDVLLDNLKRLVLEVRGGQEFVDKEGVPIKRTTAKTSLRVVQFE